MSRSLYNLSSPINYCVIAVVDKALHRTADDVLQYCVPAQTHGIIKHDIAKNKTSANGKKIFPCRGLNPDPESENLIS
jgi:hypothetical protein